MKSLNKILVAGALGLALLTECKESHELVKDWYGVVKEEDYTNATWIPYKNENGRVWTPYMNEDIKHAGYNWDTYLDMVRKENKGKLKGNILLPDLDGNGKVGK